MDIYLFERSTKNYDKYQQFLELEMAHTYPVSDTLEQHVVIQSLYVD